MIQRIWPLFLVYSACAAGAEQAWVKRGRILEPGFAGTESSNLLSPPSVVKLKNGRLRLYFWARHGEGGASTPQGRALKNHIYAAEADPAKPLEWKLVRPDPMLSPNPVGNINNAGPGFPFVVARADGPWLLFSCTR